MAGERASSILAAEIARALSRAVGDSFSGIGQQLRAFVEGMNAGNPQDMARANEDVAVGMRTAVRNAYQSEVEDERKTPSYNRPGRRSGHLGRVIRRADFVTADATGIFLGNENTLNKEAAHWRRLNFGAGEQAGSQPPPQPLRLFGEAVGTVGLPYGASPAFSLPKGFFLDHGIINTPQSSMRGRGSTGPFLPSRRSPYRPAVTEGIRGRHFIEPALEVLARELPLRYADLFNEWVQAGGDAARAINRVIGD